MNLKVPFKHGSRAYGPAQSIPSAHGISSRPSRSLRMSTIRCSSATTELPASLKSIVESFQAVPDPMQRYKQLLFFATKLEPLPAADHTPENKVKGCVSQVWVVPRVQDDGTIVWQSDSDSQLTKGLAALLTIGLSGCTAEEIVRIQPDFIAMLGLQQSLTPSRNNGFLNMFKLMQGKALEIYVQQQKQGSVRQQGSNDDDKNGSPANNDAASTNLETKGNQSASSSSNTQSNTPVQDSIRNKLKKELQPTRLEIVDESSKHAGHSGFKGSATYSGETHMNVVVVSSKFEGLTSIKRHRLVYKIIDEEMGNPIHALSLVTKTPEEAERN